MTGALRGISATSGSLNLYPNGRTTKRGDRPAMTLALSIVLIICSLGMVILVLLHRGKGGGLSSMFGGGMSSSLSGSSVVEKNLDRLTIIFGVIWAVCIVLLGLLYK